MDLHAEIYAALKYHENAARAYRPFSLSWKMIYSPFILEIWDYCKKRLRGTVLKLQCLRNLESCYKFNWVLTFLFQPSCSMCKGCSANKVFYSLNLDIYLFYFTDSSSTSFEMSQLITDPNYDLRYAIYET